MTSKQRYQFVIDYFEKHNPEAETELIYDDHYELLVAVILSAQCTDKRVNMTTPAIFQKYPDVHALSRATFDELFPFIKSISYPNNKTKHLIGMAKTVVEKFNGKIPMTVEELIKNIPVDHVHKAHHWLILHGRYICVARTPRCEVCGVCPVCKYYQANKNMLAKSL